MTAEAEAYDAARALKRERTGEGLSNADVAALRAIFDAWQPAPHNPTALNDAGSFFAAVRTAFGPLVQAQVDGFQLLLQAFGVVRWPLSWAAYGLATAWHETAATMQPVEEAFYLLGRADAYRKTLRYYPWFGRGFVQLTWKGDDKRPLYGYARADEELELGGALLADPSIALKPDIAARIMVAGMEHGWFTGKKLADYLPLSGKAGFDAYTASRRIINGTDKAAVIAKEAQAFEAALIAGGWR